MTVYRFRVKLDSDPTSLWRDIAVGENITIDKFQSTINQSVGLNQDHLWFVGEDEDYWDSNVKYQSPKEYEDLPSGGAIRFHEEVYNAGETTIGEMVHQLGLEQYDRICYLFDYGDEWRFYAILKETITEEPSDRLPEVVNEKGESVDQYSHSAINLVSLPEPLDDLPDTPVPTSELRQLKDREDVEHVIIPHTEETESGTVTEFFVAQYEDSGYILQNFPNGWDILVTVRGEDTPEKEMLKNLIEATRHLNTQMAEIAEETAGQDLFDEETVESIRDELENELERIGYGHL